ncbi:MAG: type III pantothenate kinase [Candidatus Puniceispirillales bacterium]
MLLVIDCGNTNTVIGIFEGEQKVASWRMKTDPKKTADDHAVWLDHHMKGAEISRAMVRGAVIASVVPACVTPYRKLVEDHFGVDHFIIDGNDPSHGVPILIDRPEQAGADRIANAAGAAAYDLPAIVIDFGTATTFDLVDENGAYIGGVIAPGVNLSIDALYQAAARLPLIDPSSWSTAMPVHGKSTIDAMNAGLFYGYVSLVDGMIEKITASIGRDMTVIATGGLATIFSEAIKGVDHHDPDLTLKGMVAIYTNRKQA